MLIDVARIKTEIRLNKTLLAANIPFEGFTTKGQEVSILFKPTATKQDKDLANNIVQSFDWSDNATIAYEKQSSRNEELKKIVDPVQTPDILSTFIYVMLNEMNVLRVKLGLPQYTTEDWKMLISGNVKLPEIGTLP